MDNAHVPRQEGMGSVRADDYFSPVSLRLAKRICSLNAAYLPVGSHYSPRGEAFDDTRPC